MRAANPRLHTTGRFRTTSAIPIGIRNESYRLMTGFKEDNQDVLQNIEFAIVRVYRRNSDLVDYDVEKALSVLISNYHRQLQNQASKAPRMNTITREVYEAMKAMYEWRLGREALVSEENQSQMMIPDPISVDVIIASLKRIRKSVQKWNKRGGRQGYLQFIDQFIV